MKPTTADNLAQLAADLELVPAAALHQVQRECGHDGVDADAFGQLLVRRELLTGFQLERLLKGERDGYFFGRAKLLYQIGSGSFARVYRAIHRDSGAMLAVKVLRKRYATDGEKRGSFQREGEMGRVLRHPNIVAIEDVGVEHGSAYIVMEFLEGGTLRELVRIRGALDVPRALDLVQQMLTGLEYAHRRGVTHRDMKASNVLVSATGVVKLVDFGLARVDDGDGHRGDRRVEQPRTVDYAALEKLTGVRDDDVRGDVYFMGTLAYLVLAGQPALAESRDRAVRSDPRRFTQVEPLAKRTPELPREVADFVERMMHLDPLQRFQTAADARRAVEQLAARVGAGDAGLRPRTRDAGAGAAAEPAVRGSVMVVEAGEERQAALRTFFGKLGYRVLMTESPQRALSRFGSQPLPADCLVISTQVLGDAAVEAFNAVSSDPYLADVPAILLAGARHRDVAAGAAVDARRRVVTMPVQADEIVRLLDELVSALRSS